MGLEEDTNGESIEVDYGARFKLKRKGKPPKWTTIIIYVSSLGAILSWFVIIIKHIVLWFQK